MDELSAAPDDRDADNDKTSGIIVALIVPYHNYSDLNCWLLLAPSFIFIAQWALHSGKNIIRRKHVMIHLETQLPR